MPAVFYQLAVGGYDHNFSYVIHAETGETAVVDPCGNADLILEQLRLLKISRSMILITHTHPDHIDALDQVNAFLKAPVFSARNLTDGQTISFGKEKIRCIAAPGHGSDSFCYEFPESKLLFTGDTLFIDYIGFGHPHNLFESLRKLAQLPDDLLILSGHDYGSKPYTALAVQKKENPFFITDSYDRFREQLKQLR